MSPPGNSSLAAMGRAALTVLQALGGIAFVVLAGLFFLTAAASSFARSSRSSRSF